MKACGTALCALVCLRIFKTRLHPKGLDLAPLPSATPNKLGFAYMVVPIQCCQISERKRVKRCPNSVYECRLQDHLVKHDSAKTILIL